MLLKKEGSDEGAASALERLMLATHGHLSKVANGEELLPRFHLQDPVLAAGDPITAPPLAATAFASSATFFNYAPCVLSESYTGAAGFLQGINFTPTLFSFAPTGLGVFAQGINFTPQLIYVAPTGGNIQPQGVNVQVRGGFCFPFFIFLGGKNSTSTSRKETLTFFFPCPSFSKLKKKLQKQPGLIYIGPIGGNVQPQGVNVQPIGIQVAPVGGNVQPQGALVAPVGTAIAPVDTLYNPQGVVYNKVDNDLTAAPASGADVISGL